MLPQNQVLRNRYLITTKIAQGGMGAVYKAGDQRFPGKIWAIKEMSESNIAPHERQSAIANFQREAQLLGILQHTNLPQVVDVFEDNGRQYMVMEFVDGQTLREYLDSRGGGPLPEKEMLGWAAQLCDVLEYLHGQSPPIIYRDLKPDNVMIEQATGRLKLIDFGIVRFYQAAKSKDTTALGTPGYAPPEQFGKAQTDARSDVYALAALLHHLLTGRDPVGKTLFVFPEARTLQPAISTQVNAALVKALQADRDKRPGDMAEFRKLLGLKPGGQPQPAPPQQPAKAKPAPQKPSAPSAPAPWQQITLSTRHLDFGQIVHGQRSSQQLQVSGIMALSADVRSDQAWLQATPDYLAGPHADIDVTIDTRQMAPGRERRATPDLTGQYWRLLQPSVRQYWWLLLLVFLAGLYLPAPLISLLTIAPFGLLLPLAGLQALLWLIYLHASWIVPIPSPHRAELEIDNGSIRQSVDVEVIVTPDPTRVNWSWAAAIGAVAVEVGVGLTLLLSWLGVV